jgi:putative membrane protein
MTTIETPPPAAPAPAPPPRRSGFYVAPWVLAVLGGLVLLGIGFVLGRAVDRRDDRRMGPFVRGRMGDDPGRGVGLLIFVILVVLVVTAIVLLVRHFSMSRRPVAPVASGPVPAASAPIVPIASSAEQLLADRFARGEIDEAEFVSRRNALRS